MKWLNIVLLFTLMLAVSCQGKATERIGVSDDPLEQDLGKIEAFDPAPLIIGQGPPPTLPERNASRQPASLPGQPRIVLIGLEGLIWDLLNHSMRAGQAENLIEFLGRGVRARMLTGLNSGEYADPENCWAIALGGKRNLRAKPSMGKGFPPGLLPSDAKMIWQIIPQKRFAFLDAPFTEKGMPNESVYYSKYIIDKDRDELPKTAFETETIFDNAGIKFHILGKADFNLAVMAIDELDKTQHSSLLGYVIEKARGTENIEIHQGFPETFARNGAELAALYRDFDKMIGFINENHRSDIVIIFSLHGQTIAPYEFRFDVTNKFFQRTSMTQDDNVDEAVKFLFQQHRIPGQKEIRSRAIDVLFNKTNKQDLKAKLSYPRFIFNFNSISLDHEQVAVAVGELEAGLSECRFNGMKIWHVEVEQGNSIIIEPTSEFLSVLPFSDQVMFDCGIFVNRVQGRHPGSIPGVFMAAGPGIPEGMSINDVQLIDILPTVLSAVGVDDLRRFEGSNLFATHFVAHRK